MLDAGSADDLDRVFCAARDLYEDLCYGGFSMMVDHRTTQKQDERSEIAATGMIEELYRKAKEILCKNREFLEKMAAVMAEKDVLLASDIADIREGCEVVEVSL